MLYLYPLNKEGKCNCVATIITKFYLFFRSLVANLAAANHYKKEHLVANWKTVETAEIFYISVR